MNKFLLTDDMLSNPLNIGGQTSDLYRLTDGSLLKVFKDDFLDLAISRGVSLEKKILDSEFLKSSYRINLPTGSYYDKDGKFKAYGINEVCGVNLHSYMMGLTSCEKLDLNNQALIYSSLESVVRNNPTIVFPDLCTRENFIMNNDFDITAIDFDGLQFGNNHVLGMSDMLGNYAQYENLKYMTHDGFFTKNLDKKSLIYLYFLNTFNIKLTAVDYVNDPDEKIRLLCQIFMAIGLDDHSVVDKVWKIYCNDQENEYLGEDVFRLADRYKLVNIPELVSDDGVAVNCLIKK